MTTFCPKSPICLTPTSTHESQSKLNDKLHGESELLKRNFNPAEVWSPLLIKIYLSELEYRNCGRIHSGTKPQQDWSFVSAFRVTGKFFVHRNQLDLTLSRAARRTVFCGNVSLSRYVFSYFASDDYTPYRLDLYSSLGNEEPAFTGSMSSSFLAHFYLLCGTNWSDLRGQSICRGVLSNDGRRAWKVGDCRNFMCIFSYIESGI